MIPIEAKFQSYVAFVARSRLQIPPDQRKDLKKILDNTTALMLRTTVTLSTHPMFVGAVQGFYIAWGNHLPFPSPKGELKHLLDCGKIFRIEGYVIYFPEIQYNRERQLMIPTDYFPEIPIMFTGTLLNMLKHDLNNGVTLII